MLAGFYSQFGTAKGVLQVEEIMIPQLTKGQVLVRLFNSGVNPSDYKMRLGSRPLTGPFQIPGSDGAGIIEQVGDGVSKERIGERVWVFNAAFHRQFGTSAQFTIVEDWMAQDLPANLSYAQGACLGIPVMTAYRCLFSDGPIQGKTIYIVGGAGVVAHYAIQLAKWGGAKVITSVSSDEKALTAKAAGADEIIHYQQQNVVDRILQITNQEGVDRIIEVDFGTNIKTCHQILKAGGVSVMYAFVSQPELPIPIMNLMAKNITLKFTLVYSISEKEREEVLLGIKQWLKQTKPIFNIAQQFSLTDIIQAHELVESGKKIGHVLLEITH
jgi:NADPH2:quinone reductase